MLLTWTITFLSLSWMTSLGVAFVVIVCYWFEPTHLLSFFPPLNFVQLFLCIFFMKLVEIIANCPFSLIKMFGLIWVIWFNLEWVEKSLCGCQEKIQKKICSRMDCVCFFITLINWLCYLWLFLIQNKQILIRIIYHLSRWEIGFFKNQFHNVFFSHGCGFLCFFYFF